LNYWRRQLQGLPNLALPYDRLSPSQPTFHGARASIKLSQQLSEDLKTVAISSQVTLYMILLGAFKVLLHRWTGQEDIVVGTVTAGRNRSELERVFGFFLNVVVLRTSVTDASTFADYLLQLRQVVLEAASHDRAPFDVLMNELRADNGSSCAPLFNSMFSMEPQLVTEPGWDLTQMEVDTGTTKYDLDLEADNRKDGTFLRLTYNRDVFEPSSMERFLEQIQLLLREVAAAPHARIADLKILSKEDRKKVLSDWNQTAAVYPLMPVHRIFEQLVARQPNAIAVTSDDGDLSYSALHQRSNALARAMLDSGVRKHGHVAILANRTPDMVVALLAVLKCGAVYVPLDVQWPDRNDGIVREANVQAILAESKLGALVPERVAPVLLLDQFASRSAAAPELEVQLDDPACLCSTSGTAAEPRLVEVKHRGIVRLAFGLENVRLDSNEVILQLSPLSFDAATFEIWGALLTGATLALFPEAVPSVRSLGSAIQRFNISTMWLTASLFHAIIDEAPEILSPIRQLLTGGEPLSVSRVRRALEVLPDTRFINAYGPTEATTFSCCYHIPATLPGNLKSIPIGKPLRNTQIYVFDSNQRPVPVGVPGEIYIGGDGIARGYLARADLTTKRFLPDPSHPGQMLYRTGDIGRFLANGHLEFLGRQDREVKISGRRIIMDDVEGLIRRCPGLKDVAVLDADDAQGTKQLLAFVIAQNRSDLSGANIRSFLRRECPGYMIPARIVMLSEFPRLRNGKLDRRALLRLASADSDKENAPQDQDALAQRLRSLWTRLLNSPKIDPEHNLFECGGSSLDAIRLISAIEKEFARSVPLQSVLRGQTFSEMAAVLRVPDVRPVGVSAFGP
jgi:amino acid adenylation domain-containing protein